VTTAWCHNQRPPPQKAHAHTSVRSRTTRCLRRASQSVSCGGATCWGAGGGAWALLLALGLLLGLLLLLLPSLALTLLLLLLLGGLPAAAPLCAAGVAGSADGAAGGAAAATAATAAAAGAAGVLLICAAAWCSGDARTSLGARAVRSPQLPHVRGAHALLPTTGVRGCACARAKLCRPLRLLRGCAADSIAHGAPNCGRHASLKLASLSAGALRTDLPRTHNGLWGDAAAQTPC
jgi:hypothetical protein